MIKPEGKLTVITDLGECKSNIVDGVRMETVRQLESDKRELMEAIDNLCKIKRNPDIEIWVSVPPENEDLLSSETRKIDNWFNDAEQLLERMEEKG